MNRANLSNLSTFNMEVGGGGGGGGSTGDSDFQSFVLVLVTFGLMLLFLVHMIQMHRRGGAQACSTMSQLYPSMNGQISNIDDTFRLRACDYYAMTAFNACSGGKYENDYVDLCNLKAVLREGVRCVDMEVYSEQRRPVVATSVANNRYVKTTFNSIPLREVVETLATQGFAFDGCPNPRDPLFVHLRLQTQRADTLSQIAAVLRSHQHLLVPRATNIATAPLESLRGKLIVMADRPVTDVPELAELINLQSNSARMRLYRFPDVQHHRADGQEWVAFNALHFSMVIPDPKTSDPANPDPALCHRQGCQMVAMRYQHSDDALRAYRTFFRRHGRAFVAKPESLR